MTDRSLRFPYMFWAHTESFVSPYSLSQSGMPAADPAVLEPLPPLDLGPAGADAMPRVEARLAELFGVDPSRLVLTAGASGAMNAVAATFFRDGARVVTEIPSYEPFRALPGVFGATTHLVERRVERGFVLDVEAVAAGLEGASPGHVFVSTPHNPTGVVTPREDVLALAELAADAGGVLVSSEVYMEFAQPDERVHAFQLAPNAVSLGSLTKAYGLGALRIGWILLGEGLVDRRDELVDATYLAYVDPPTPVLRLTERALDRLEPLLRPLRHLEAHCRPHLVRWLEETPGVTAPVPRLGLTAFPRIDGVEDTRALARHLAETVGVDVVPGEFFGCPGHLRVGFGVPEATLVEGLERLTRGIEAFRS